MKSTTFERRLLGILVLMIFCHKAISQSWKIDAISSGMRVFDQQLVGTNPIAVAPQMKDPLAYQIHLNSLPSSSLSGNPAVVPVSNLYIGLELKRNKPSSRFWRRHSIPLGLVWTNKNEYDIGAIGEILWMGPPDPGYRGEHYHLERSIRFLGLYTGLNRFFRISRNLFFVTGLQGQASIAIQHTYRQSYVTNEFTLATGRKMTVIEDQPLQGKTYFQWQAFIPIAFEFRFLKDRIGIRAEADIGVLGNPFLDKTLAAMENHGIGATIKYRLAYRQLQ